MRNLERKEGFHDERLRALMIDGAGDLRLAKPVIVNGEKPIRLETQHKLAQEYWLALSTAH